MTQIAHPDSILIIDFGSQVTQLIARRVREAGVYCEIHPFNNAEDAFARNLPEGSNFGFLPKPFSLKQLATTVREMLDS